jgi:homoserine kinase type II
MSVYTQLSLSDIQLFATNYGLNIVDYQAIQSGIENSNFFISTEAGKDYVLTLFEELNAQEAAFLAPLLQHLQQAGVLVAAPLVANNGQSLLTLKDKPAQLAPRILGATSSTSHTRTSASDGRTISQAAFNTQKISFKTH